MQLSVENRDRLVRELRNASAHMSQVGSAQEKLYFFSAVFGVANRIMNLEFDPELAFVHYVTNAAYNTMNNTLITVAKGQSMKTLPPHVFEKLQEAVEDLVKCIEQQDSTYIVLQNISNLAYSTTGNGYYLYLNGALDISIKRESR